MSELNPYFEKVVVITGASSGFGCQASLELARRGAHVVLAARSEQTLHELASQCEMQDGGCAALAVPTDVSRREDVQQLFEMARRRFGKIDAWINNAGVGVIGRFDEVPIEDHEQVIRTDLLGTLYGSYEALRYFRRTGVGVLINVASVVGKIPAPLYTSYVAAKFGVVGFSDALRQELKAEGVDRIHVCTVMPMAHTTEFFEHAGNYSGRESTPIPPVYDPKVTVDKLVQLVVEPEDEVITGWQGPVFNTFHKLLPGAVEKLMSARTQKTQLEDAEPMLATSGTIHEPSSA
ncbi:Glucose 1-dehydrogenase [Caulifigura coniformis]|uniref:Glucose 1-dehydrogenase n=1 Tax=Caulifigura coniformis TaxID=2527983 RepID=A0A517SCC3_9PLAN|nr:SDR family NAD(P)-dependent oxidoreductase [Caulifigura coniformis]QDT53772.1 Glucose 1-dehydrogenase [Caulifigura coniformis]